MTGERAESQKALVKNMAQICSYLVPDDKGVELRFINANPSGVSNLRADGIERIMAAVQPLGYTAIGLNLREKILRPLIYDVLNRGEKLSRPYLISIITDGIPEGKAGVSRETPGTLKEVIAECADKLTQTGYEP